MVPDYKPSARRKQRTKVENLEIDLKSWNSIYVNSNIQSLLSDERPSYNNLDFNVFNDEQSYNKFYKSFIEVQSFDDYILLT